MSTVKILFFLLLVSLSNFSQAEKIQVSEDLSIYYEQSGTGATTLLFIPGYTMTTKVFEKQLAYFGSSEKYRFITYDPRGQGNSSKTEGGHFYEQHGKDLNYFIEALELDNIILAGWSYGGLDALSYINQFGSERIQGLILIDAPPKSAGNDNTKEWVWYNYDDSDGFFEFFTMAPLRDRESFNLAFAEWMLEDASEKNVQWVTKQSNTTSNTVAALLNAAGYFLNYEPELIKLHNEKIPLLYITQEAYYPLAKQWAKTNTPNASVHGFGKHLMFWERDTEFNHILLSFLTSLELKQ